MDLSSLVPLVPSPLGSSSSGGRYRPTWRPRREALNIDSIFTRPRGSSLGYNTLPGPSLLSAPQDCGSPGRAAPPTQPGSLDVDRRQVGESEVGFGLVGQPRSLGSGRTMGPPATLPPRGVEHQPRLIQRMESGYESSERNSSSPDRLIAHKQTAYPLKILGSWRCMVWSLSSLSLCSFFFAVFQLSTGRWGNRNGYQCQDLHGVRCPSQRAAVPSCRSCPPPTVEGAPAQVCVNASLHGRR